MDLVCKAGNSLLFRKLTGTSWKVKKSCSTLLVELVHNYIIFLLCYDEESLMFLYIGEIKLDAKMVYTHMLLGLLEGC